jgi:hypothetical protein
MLQQANSMDARIVDMASILEPDRKPLALIKRVTQDSILQKKMLLLLQMVALVVLLVPSQSRLASRPLALSRTALPVSIRPKQLLPRRLTVALIVDKASNPVLDRRHPASTRPVQQDSTRLRTTPLTIPTVAQIAE